MKTVALRILGITALILAAGWAVAEADDMKEPHGDVMYIHGNGPMPMMDSGGPMMMPMPMAGDPMHLVRLAEELDLSPDQRKQVGVIMDSTMPKLRDLMFRMADARKALHDYKKADKKDEAALRKITDEHGKITSEMMFLTMKMHQDMHAVLNEGQLKKLHEMKKHMHGGHMHGMRFFNRHIDDDEDEGEDGNSNN